MTTITVVDQDATQAARIAHYMRMRAVAIQFLHGLEDELVALGGIQPSDRACMTREERRALLQSIDTK